MHQKNLRKGTKTKMTLTATTDRPVIERDVHCPFCKSENALLISEIAAKSSVLQTPAPGLKYWLRVFFTLGGHMWTHGFPMFEKKRKYEYDTYGFCPHCGKTYNAAAPGSLSAQNQPPQKVYKSVSNKKVMGVCAGVAEYTGLSVKTVRVAMVVNSIVVIPAILYFVFGFLLDENPNGKGA
jgi:phage shock protein PspC (stress-responsive transcriptional regulator)